MCINTMKQISLRDPFQVLGSALLLPLQPLLGKGKAGTVQYGIHPSGNDSVAWPVHLRFSVQPSFCIVHLLPASSGHSNLHMFTFSR